MSDGSGGPDRGLAPDLQLSRRRLLTALAGTGAVGAMTGGVAGAVLRDRETFARSDLVAGALDMRVDWETATDAGSGDGAVTLPLGTLAPGDRGTADLTVSVPQTGGAANNPAYVWLRSSCPSPSSALDDALEVRLSYLDCRTGRTRLLVGPASLRDLANDLRNGRPLSADLFPGADPGEQSCVEPGSPLCLRLAYELPADYVGDETVSLTWELVATQCRHDDGTTNPFVDSARPPCDPADTPCVCCERVGKLELEDTADPDDGLGENRVEPGTYAFTEGYISGWPDYRLEVLETVVKTDEQTPETVAVRIRVLDPAGTPVELCGATVAAGPNGTATYELDGTASPLLTTAPRDAGADVRTDPGAFPGVSNLVVEVCTDADPAVCGTARGGTEDEDESEDGGHGGGQDGGQGNGQGKGQGNGQTQTQTQAQGGTTDAA